MIIRETDTTPLAPISGYFMRHRRRFLKFVTICSLFWLFVAPVFADLLLESEFESGKWETYGWSRSGTSPQIVQSQSSPPPPVCRGKYDVKFHIDYDKGNYRSELALTSGSINEFKIGNEYWLGFGVFIPSDWASDGHPDGVMQFHGRPDFHLGETWRQQPINLFINNDSWKFWMQYDPEPVGKPRKISADLGPIENDKGKWTEFVLRIKFSYNQDGFVEIWKNGKKIKTLNGGNAYNDAMGPYLKVGNYKPAWIPEVRNTWGGADKVRSRTHYIDEIRVGDKNAKYEDVAPYCNKNVPKNPTGIMITKHQ